MKFKELRYFVIDPETNKCRGCNRQISHLREHVLNRHLEDIDFF